MKGFLEFYKFILDKRDWRIALILLLLWTYGFIIDALNGAVSILIVDLAFAVENLYVLTNKTKR